MDKCPYSYLIGSGSAPYSLAAQANKTQSLTLVALQAVAGPVTYLESAPGIAVNITIGSTPSAAPTIAFGYTFDGVLWHWFASSVTPTTTTGSYAFAVPANVQSMAVSVTNNDTGSVSIGVQAIAGVRVDVLQ